MSTTKPTPGGSAHTAGPMHGVSTISDFGSSHVRAGVHRGQPMFAAKDVCAILGLTNTGEAISSLDSDEKEILSHGALVAMGIVRADDLEITRLAMITESGIYSLVYKSIKPEAKRFKKWVTSAVLPSIRRNGWYCVQPPSNALVTMEEIAALAQLMAAEEHRYAGR